MLKQFDSLYERAVRSLVRRCRDDGSVFQQPCKASSYVADDGTLILRNVRGELARYAERGSRLVRVG
jgi:hypothetical protein